MLHLKPSGLTEYIFCLKCELYHVLLLLSLITRLIKYHRGQLRIADFKVFSE